MGRVFWSICSYFSLIILLLVSLGEVGISQKFSRDDFPNNFIFGSGSSAYQVEGAANEDGRTPSVWDTFAHAGKMVDNSNGDIAIDQYHKYKGDVKLMADTGLDAYRFSISWSRLIPNGRGPVNPKGLQYYNNLINELLSYGIQAHVTLFHYDLPQTLEDEYGGWLSRKIVKDFTAYAEVCFREFGDRVSTWTTINEANVFVLGGYDIGFFPPGRCSSPFGFNCTAGNSVTEPYVAAHNCLLAHASAAKLYKQKFQAKQQGLIGLNLYSNWLIPVTNSTEDVAATQRLNNFFIGWFADPLVFGDYPDTVKKNAGSRIPSFAPEESKLVKGSYDFFGVNYYITAYVKDNSIALDIPERDVFGDMAAQFIFNGVNSDQDWTRLVRFKFTNQNGLTQFPVYPPGLQGVLEYFKQVYGNPPLYIHENGQRTSNTLNDIERVEYIEGYIGGLLNAVRNGSNTRGYFTWSFLDSFELLDGYKACFGLYSVDFNDPHLKRQPKLSAHWYTNFLKGSSKNINTNYSIMQVDNNSSTNQLAE